MIGAPTTGNRIVTCGQSLNNQPVGYNFWQRLARRYANCPLGNGAIGGIAWLQWASPDWQHMIHVYLPYGARVVVCMLGGTADYSDTCNRTGAQCYADEVSIANAVRGMRPPGVVKVIGSTTTPCTAFGLRATVTAASNGVDVASFAGSGTLNVDNLTSVLTDTAAHRTVIVQTSTGRATVTYTAAAANQLTGCTTTAGTGTVATGNWVRTVYMANCIDGNALVVANGDGAFDAVVDYYTLMPDPTNTTYYAADGVHETATGANLMIQSGLAPKLEPLLL